MGPQLEEALPSAGGEGPSASVAAAGRVCPGLRGGAPAARLEPRGSCMGEGRVAQGGGQGDQAVESAVAMRTDAAGQRILPGE
eukprot:10929082-Lingulodinium_polyedra.AAC.1